MPESLPTQTEEYLRARLTGHSHIRPIDMQIGLMESVDPSRFVDTCYPDLLDPAKLFVTVRNREPQGSGPHFDAYTGLLSPYYPWVAVCGKGAVKMTGAELPAPLGKQYDQDHPDPGTEAAYVARRNYGAIALNSETNRPSRTHSLDGTWGFVLTQIPDRPYFVHNIEPVNPRQPGALLKLALPADDRAAKVLTEAGYAPFDEEILDEFTALSLDDHPRRRRISLSLPYTETDPEPQPVFTSPRTGSLPRHFGFGRRID